MSTMDVTLPKWAQSSAATPRTMPDPQASCMLRPAVPPVLVLGASSFRRLARGARTRGCGGTGGARRDARPAGTAGPDGDGIDTVGPEGDGLDTGGTETIGTAMVAGGTAAGATGAGPTGAVEVGAGATYGGAGATRGSGAGGSGGWSASITSVSSSSGRSAVSKRQGWRSMSTMSLLLFIIEPTGGSSSESMEGSKSSSCAAQSVSSSRQLGGANVCSSPLPRSRMAGTCPVGASFQCGMSGFSSTTGPVTSCTALPAGSAPMMRTRPDR
jgi:hypothetical protein